MDIASLEDLYIAELQELSSGEGLMAEYLARLGKLALHRTPRAPLPRSQPPRSHSR
jgi:hypothetical protein